ncbi:MAG: HNH endonuclease [Syntrophaceae bacterium]
MKYVYCVEDKPLSSFTKIEHVIPQSFGLFANNFTLVNIVCDVCNQYFGDNLEIVMARDTFEGASRFEFELKSPKEFKSLGKRSRVTIKIAEGECKGAYAYREYSKEQDKIIVKPVPKIGFLKNEPSEYEYYLLDQIPSKSYLDENGFDLKPTTAIRALGIDVGTARQVLSEKGIKFAYQGEAGPSENPKEDWLCEVDALIDSTIFRTVAKIAFNYLAYWEGRDFLLNSAFDQSRGFIRYGKKADYPLVMVDDNPILRDEPIEGRRRLGHIITVNWASDKISIVSQISLFNWASYRISLARNLSGEQRSIRHGHFFNVNSHEILDLEVRSISQ